MSLDLPFISLQVQAPEMKMPHVEMPGINRAELGHAVDIAKTFLPPPERLVYYGGLGALAVLGFIEWPVAAAIGAGTMIAQRARGAEKAWAGLLPPTTTRPSARRTTTRRTRTATRRTASA